MNRIVTGVLMAGLLAGCSSTPTKDQDGATVEDRKPTVAQPEPKPVVVPEKKKPVEPIVTKPVQDTGLSAAALKDPANILSRRIIQFDYDSFMVKDEYKPLVTAHARYLTQNPKASMTIQGHTDERGSREYNLALGQRRADAVKQMLQLLGASAAQIETVSFGEEKPRAQGSNEQAWAENRRAEIVYQGE